MIPITTLPKFIGWFQFEWLRHQEFHVSRLFLIEAFFSMHRIHNVNVQRGLYGNALQVASVGGHEGIVRLLLQMSMLKEDFMAMNCGRHRIIWSLPAGAFEDFMSSHFIFINHINHASPLHWLLFKGFQTKAECHNDRKTLVSSSQINDIDFAV